MFLRTHFSTQENLMEKFKIPNEAHFFFCHVKKRGNKNGGIKFNVTTLEHLESIQAHEEERAIRNIF